MEFNVYLGQEAKKFMLVIVVLPTQYRTKWILPNNKLHTIA